MSGSPLAAYCNGLSIATSDPLFAHYPVPLIW